MAEGDSDSEDRKSSTSAVVNAFGALARNLHNPDAFTFSVVTVAVVSASVFTEQFAWLLGFGAVVIAGYVAVRVVGMRHTVAVKQAEISLNYQEGEQKLKEIAALQGVPFQPRGTGLLSSLPNDDGSKPGGG